jgi:sulfatase modifying factor 1
MAPTPSNKHDGHTPLNAAREAIKKGETQKAGELLAAVRLDRMTDEEKELLVVVARAVHLERQLASHIKEAKEDNSISLVEAASMLMLCREYMSINPDNPRVQKLASQCRNVLGKAQGDDPAPDGSVLTAAIAVRYLEDNNEIDLDDFQSITEEAAQVLALHDGDLYLNGLKDLSPASAKGLASHTEELSLSGLLTIHDAVAEALAQYAGSELALNGLNEVTPEAARSLSRYRGKLSLNGITQLSAGVAESLAQHKGQALSLNGVEELTSEAATALASYHGELDFWNLTLLSAEAARALSQHPGKLSLYRLESPSDQVCEALDSKLSLKLPGTVISPRIKSLWAIAGKVPSSHLLSIFWGWERRETLSKTTDPDIPGGYGGPLDRPAMTSDEISKEDGRWRYRVTVIQLDNEFPTEELQSEAQKILDAAPHGAPVEITVESGRPGTDSECEYFWGDEEGYREWAGEDDDEDEDDADGDDESDDDEKNEIEPANAMLNKAEEIRKVAKAMEERGEKPRPATIIAALMKQAIVVSAPQVSMVLKTMGFRPSNGEAQKFNPAPDVEDESDGESDQDIENDADDEDSSESSARAEDPRIRRLWKRANTALPTDVLSILWERDGEPDIGRRMEISEEQYPDIPGGYWGEMRKPAIADWSESGAQSLHIRVVIGEISCSTDELQRAFPSEELRTAAQAILDEEDGGSRIIVSVENDVLGGDAECSWYIPDYEEHRCLSGMGRATNQNDAVVESPEDKSDAGFGNRESIDAVLARTNESSDCAWLRDPAGTITNSLGMKFVPISPGEFMMGDPDSGGTETFCHKVRITNPFHLGMFAVTQGEYFAVTGNNPSYYLGKNRPVERLSWSDAMQLCKLLTALPQEAAAGRSYRLPTEAEWEYACRAGTSTDFWFGKTADESKANFSEDGFQSGPQPTLPVGCFAPNGWGLYDTHGNVWEWCADWFDDEYYEKSPQENPSGPETGSHHTLRGGAASNDGTECKSYSRGEASRCDGPSIRVPAQGRYEALGDFGVRLVCCLKNNA